MRPLALAAVFAAYSPVGVRNAKRALRQGGYVVLATGLDVEDGAWRATAFSGGLSALFGITEPALYGVTLQNKRALISVISGSVVGGAYIGATQVAAFALVSPGVASISMFIDGLNPWNLLNAVIGLLISLFMIASARRTPAERTVYRDRDVY